MQVKFHIKMLISYMTEVHQEFLGRLVSGYLVSTPGGSMSSLNSALVSKNRPQPQSCFRPQDFHFQLELSPSPRITLILTEISLVTLGSLVLVAQSYQTLCEPTDYSLPVSTVRGILQARILEWVAMSSARGSSGPGIEPGSPALQAHSLLSEPPGKSKVLKDRACFPFCTC